MLDIGDLFNLIRLTELEIQRLQHDIDGEDDNARNDAGEVILQFDALSQKLKKIYEEKYFSESGYPTYLECIYQIRNFEKNIVD